MSARGLDEAGALRFRAVRRDDSTGEIAERVGEVAVTVQTTPVEHRVNMARFRQRIKRGSREPKGMSSRSRLRETLGISR